MTPAFKKVVVPVEFEPAKSTEFAPDRLIELAKDAWVAVGPPTAHALELAAELVGKDGEVCLVHATPDLHATQMYGGPEGTWIPLPKLDELHAAARTRSQQVLERIAERFCKGANVSYDIRPGPPLTVIVEAASKDGVDAIVLAASGRGRVRRALLGSIADKVIRNAPCPVMVVPSGTE